MSTLRDGGRGTVDSAAGKRLRRALIVAEMSLACVVLVGAGLLALDIILEGKGVKGKGKREEAEGAAS